MGIETLNSAARAAGFAMAASEEPYEEPRNEPEPIAERPRDALMLTPVPIARHHGMAERLRTMLGFFGRRAPA